MNETTAVEIPKINVNLAPCNPKYPTAIAAHSDGEHPIGCPGAPVLVPLPLDTWRTVTMKVVLGECDCDAAGVPAHAGWCSSTPIEVTCSIRGKAWPESEVDDDDIEIAPGQDAVYWLDSEEKARAVSACRDRWALVKAMVLGLSDMCSPIIGQRVLELRQRRDAVFAVIADMRRMEVGQHEAFLRLPLDLRKDVILAKACGPTAGDPRDGGIDLPSARILKRYVARLITQVGELP